MRRFVAASFVVVAVAPAVAADRKVPSQTYPTIAAAAAAAQPGDRILVAPGRYAENVATDVAKLQFIGKNAFWDGTLDDGAPGVCLTATGGKTLVQGFTFRSGLANTAQVQLTGDDCKVIKCTRAVRVRGSSRSRETMRCSILARSSPSTPTPS
jgi:hypothetical protein